MKRMMMQGKHLAFLLLFIASGAAAQQKFEDLSGFLPPTGEVAGWTLIDVPKDYRGDDLYRMIDGGADIYYEYGFTQALGAEYVDGRGKSIKLEMYEMESPAAAYGIYSFKIGDGGKAQAIGQEARIEEYYLNFWKGNLQLTLIGQDAEEETVRGVVALAKAIDARITKMGERPELANLLLREPLAFSHPKYLRGPLGLMNHYRFDRENIFRIREGLIGAIDNCRAMVFRYTDESESAKAFEHATTILSAGSRFTNHTRQGNRYAMTGGEKERVVVIQTRRYIAIVIGQDQEKVSVASDRLVQKLQGT